MLEYTIRRDGDDVMISTYGDLDAHSAHGFETLCWGVLVDSPTSLLLDTSGSTFVDSSGLRALMALRERCNHERTHFRLVGRSAALDRLLDLTRLHEYFEHADQS